MSGSSEESIDIEETQRWTDAAAVGVERRGKREQEDQEEESVVAIHEVAPLAKEEPEDNGDPEGDPQSEKYHKLFV